MIQFFRTCLKATLGLCALIGIAFANHPNEQFHRALKLNVDKKGFEALSVAATEYMKGPQHTPVDNREFSVPPLAILQFKDMSVDYQINGVNIIPYQDGLVVVGKMNRLALHVNKFEVKNWILRFLKATCYGTHMYLQAGEEVPVSMAMKIKQTLSGVKVDFTHLKFHIPDGKLKSHGPRECRGIFKEKNKVTRWIYRKLASLSTSFFEKGLRNYATKMANQFEGQINDALNGTHFVALPGVKSMLEIHARPRHLRLSSNGLRSEFSLNYGVANPSKAMLSPWLWDMKDGLKGDAKTPYGDATANLHAMANIKRVAELGSATVNPKMVEYIMHFFARDQKEALVVDSETHELLSLLLDRENLGMYWPELEEDAWEGKAFRLSIHPDKNFKGAFNPLWESAHDDKPEETEVEMKVSQLPLTLQYFDGTRWKNYYELKINAGFAVKAVELEAKPLGFMMTRPSLTVSGQWAKGHRPSDDTFYREDFEYALFGIMEAVESARQKISPFPVQGLGLIVGPEKMILEAPNYVGVNLVQYL